MGNTPHLCEGHGNMQHSSWITKTKPNQTQKGGSIILYSVHVG
ncbi:unnamed protein product [Phytomonas sp. EM1]|nr:unnamed protein product [Phytomonas sp. EM1]|eukprot:CCW65166.1 unnamed protein product [Phytomonas sp. isolate EM1]